MNVRGDITTDQIVWAIIIALTIGVLIILITGINPVSYLEILFPDFGGVVVEEEEQESGDDEGGVEDGVVEEVDPECKLKSARWILPGISGQEELATNAFVNQIVELVVTGENCEDEIVSFEIREIDNDNNFIWRGNGYVKVRPKNAVFDENNIAKGSWNVERELDWFFTNPEYRFRATLDSGEFVTSKDLEVSKR